MKAFNFFGAVLAVSLIGCASKSLVDKGKVVDTIRQDAIDGAYFEAIGIAAADPSHPTQTQRRALSRDAAIIKAHAELLAMIKGAQVDGGQTVEMSIMGKQEITETISSMIKGAEILKTEFTADDGAVATIRLPRKRAEKMLGVKFR